MKHAIEKLIVFTPELIISPNEHAAPFIRGKANVMTVNWRLKAVKCLFKNNTMGLKACW